MRRDRPIPGPVTPKRLRAVLILFGLLLVACAVGSLGVGPTRIALLTALSEPASRDAEILFLIRLPWVLLAAVVGAGLSTVGVAFQALLRNPLADPFILGMSGGAAFGVVVGLALGVPNLAPAPTVIPLLGFAGALGATLLVWRLSSVRGQTNHYTMLLAGVVVNAIFGAAIMFLISLARPEAVHNTALWLMGILDVFQISRPLLYCTTALTLAGVFLLCTLGKDLNALSLGEITAHQLGTNVRRTRSWAFFLGAVVVGSATAIAGPIGFVGLLIPHLLRLTIGPDHRLLLPTAALAGGIFLLVTGSVARAVFPLTQTQVPVGVITACLGGPFFLWLLRKRGKLYG